MPHQCLTSAAEVEAFAISCSTRVAMAATEADESIILYEVRTIPINWTLIKVVDGVAFLKRLERRRGPMGMIVDALYANCGCYLAGKAAFDG
jgi:hypothetical protein